MYYDLYVAVDPDKKFISGTNLIRYGVLNESEVMQIDLQEPMKIIKVVQDNEELKVTHEGNAHFIQLKQQQKGSVNEVIIHFEGIC